MAEPSNAIQLSQRVTGLSFIDDIYEVTSYDPPLLVCSLRALTGPSDNLIEIRYEAKVVGEITDHLVRKCQDAVLKRKDSLLIEHVLQDPKLHEVKPRSGTNKGAKDTFVEVELHAIHWIKINGQFVWKSGTLSAESTERLELNIHDSRSMKSRAPAGAPSDQFEAPQAP